MQQIDPNMKVPILAGLVMLGLLAAIVASWLWALIWLAVGGKFLPRTERKLVPWGARSVFVCIVTYVILQVVAATFYTRAVYQGKPPLSEDQKQLALSARDHLAISAGSNILVLVVVPILLFLGSRARLHQIGFTWRDAPMNIVRGLIAYPLLAPIVFAAFGAALSYWGKTNHPMEDVIRNDQSGTTIALTVLTGVILAPVVEELMFRGMLLGWLLSVVRRNEKPVGDDIEPVLLYADDEITDPLAPTGSAENPIDLGLDHDPHNPFAAPAALPSRAMPPRTRPEWVVPGSDGLPGFFCNVAVSLIFALLHGKQWPAPIPIFILSLGLGYLFQRTGSLVPNITLHMVFNGISTMLMFLIAGSGLADRLPGAKPAEKVIIKTAEETLETPKPLPVAKDSKPKAETKQSSPK